MFQTALRPTIIIHCNDWDVLDEKEIVTITDHHDEVAPTILVEATIEMIAMITTGTTIEVVAMAAHKDHSSKSEMMMETTVVTDLAPLIQYTCTR